MKKTMTKIFALVLVCAMLIGFVAMIPAYAAENDSVQIVSHNVLFDDYLQIMYALDVPAGQTVERIKLTDGNGNEFEAVPHKDKDGNDIPALVGGVEYPAYVATTGVSLQNIDTPVTAEVYVDGEVVVTDEYSVLQYLHNRMIGGKANDNQKAMYESLLQTAEKMQVVINGNVTLHNTSYVKVINGNIGGSKTETMLNVGATLESVDTDLVPGENQEIQWTVTEYTDAGVAGAPQTKTTEEMQAIVVEEGVNLVLEAGLEDVAADEPVIANGNFVIAVHHNDAYYAMDAALNDKNRINNVAINVFNGNVTSDGAPEWTVTNVAGGVTLHNGSQYLGQKTADEAYFVLSDEPVVWTVAKGENGEIYLNSTLANETERGILFNTNSSLNQFGVYATSNGTNNSYARAMLFMVYSKCDHNGVLENYEAPTCGEEGYSGDTICSICGALMAPGETLEATGEHNYENGTCSVCGAADPNSGTTTPRYVKVTSADELTSGTYVIVLSSTKQYALTKYNSGWVEHNNGTTTFGDEITEADGASLAWTLTVDGTSVKMQDINGKYIAPKSGNTNGVTNSQYNWAWSFADGKFQFKGTGSDTTTLAGNSGSSYKLRAYKNSTVSGNANSYPSYFILYKLVED